MAVLHQDHLLPPLAADALPVDVDAFLPAPAALAAAWERLPGDEDLARVLGSLGAPRAALCASPAAARAGLLGLRLGRGFYHHELRVRLPVPEALRPEVAPWASPSLLPQWADGVLAEPKYFSFFLDGAHSAFNPNHRGKWTSHELLHAVVGFSWHPALSPFECYLSGRISELLPVVHWYGLDELYRARCPAHAAPPRETCPACEALAQAPYWAHERGPLRAAAEGHAANARAHLAVEWAAVLAELDTGRRRATPAPAPHAPGVDGSSDAEAYLLAHWERLTAWSFGAWVERFLVAGVDHERTAWEHAARLARACHALTSGPLEVDPEQSRRLAERRVLQDLGYRLLWALEEAEAVEDTLLPRVDALAGAAGALLAGEAVALEPLVEEALAAVDAVADRLPAGLAARIGGLGYRWCLRQRCVDAGLEQVDEGLALALPDSLGELTEREELAWRFADSDAFDEPGPIATRFAAWWEAEGGPDADAVRLEALVGALPRRDAEAELYAVVPEQGLPAHLRPNETLRRAWVDPEVLQAEPVRTDDEGRIEVAVAWMDGEPAVVVLDHALAEALDAVAEGREAPVPAVRPLLEAGLVVGWDPPRR